MRPERVFLPDDSEKRVQLLRMRRAATAVLVALAGVYAATHAVPDPGRTVLLIRAMAEAGMVGGLADWFAVEALFRHPLRVPVPHTALLPRNQARVADSIGQFIETWFLDPAQIRERVVAMRPVRMAATWVARPANARLGARYAVAALAAVLETLPPLRLRRRDREALERFLMEATPEDELAAPLADFLCSTLHGPLVDRLLGLVKRGIEQDQDRILDLVQARSRWWVAAPVDRRVAGALGDGVLSVIDEMSEHDSTLRRDFEAAAEAVIRQLAADGTLAALIGEAKRELLAGGTLDAMASRLAGDLHERLSAQLRDNPDVPERQLAGLMMAAARRLEDDPAGLDQFERRLADVAAEVALRVRPHVGGYFADVIRSWDTGDLSDRFEVEVGRDLQFIRINGAILGSLIGGVLFWLGHILG